MISFLFLTGSKKKEDPSQKGVGCFTKIKRNIQGFENIQNLEIFKEEKENIQKVVKMLVMQNGKTLV